MTSIAVVTKRAGFTLTFHSPGHRFTEVRPSPGWLVRTWSEDVVILDLGSAATTRGAVETLRASAVNTPVIVVANDTDGWDELIAAHADLHLISMPVSPTALLTTVDRAARASRAARAVASEPSPETARREPVPEESQGRANAEPVLAGTAPAQLPDLDPLPVPRPSVTLPRSASPRRRRAAPVAEPLRTSPEVVLPSPPDDPVTKIRELLPQVGRLSRTAEVAEMLRLRCATAAACDASAVLVPDGPVWRVAAGERLRPLEERIQLDQHHWLISEVVGQGHGLLIRDTDIARTNLSGSPLASWPNLLALPVVEVSALVLLARREQPFTRENLTAAQVAIGPAAIQLEAALQVRALARALAQFSDTPL